MVPKGLKKGDTFEDGGLCRVLETLPNGGYISERLAKGTDAINSGAPTTEPPAGAKPTAAQRAPRKRRN